MKPVSHSDPRGGHRAATVLVICESEALRVAVEISLSLVGYRVVTADNAEAGLSAFAAAQPQLVVVQGEWQDDDTEGETTLALLRAIRAGHHSVPFLVLAQGERELSEALLKGGAVEHICVPWNEERLRSSAAYLIRRCAFSTDRSEPTKSEIEQVLLHARGVLSKAARDLGMTAEELEQRLRKLRLSD